MYTSQPSLYILCLSHVVWLLRFVLVHSGFDGDSLLFNLSQVLIAGIYLTALGFHPGGHSCIADQVWETRSAVPVHAFQLDYKRQLLAYIYCPDCCLQRPKRRGMMFHFERFTDLMFDFSYEDS